MYYCTVIMELQTRTLRHTRVGQEWFDISKRWRNECLSTRTLKPASLVVPCSSLPCLLPWLLASSECYNSSRESLSLPLPLSLLSLSPHDPLMKAAVAPSPIGRRRAPRGRGHALPLAGGGGGGREEDALSQSRGRREEKRALQVEGAHHHCTDRASLLQSRNIALPKGHP